MHLADAFSSFVFHWHGPSEMSSFHCTKLQRIEGESTILSETESKEKHGVWDSMPELTMTSPYVPSGVGSYTFTMGNPMPGSTLTLCQSRH